MHTQHLRATTPALAWIRGGSLAALLWLCHPREARGEDSVSYKYQSWQEDNQRIRVDSHYVDFEKDIDTETRFTAMGLIDSIAGATPTGELPRTPGGPVPVAPMEDLRHAMSVGLAHQFPRVKVDLGYAYSKESDYISHGWSVNTVTDFNQKNTNLLVGFGHTDDYVHEPKLGWTIDRPKKGNDFIVGVTQLLDANTSLTGNVSYGRSRGFLSDPYKIVSTTMLDLDPGTYYTPPENRPTEKNKVSVFLGLNRNVEKWHAALDASYRFYHDTFGITGHTVALRWLQDLGEHWTVEPSVRYYVQSAASFYYFDLDHAGIVTTFEPVLGETGTGRAPFYSSDYRLSHMQTVDAGLKLTWKPRPWLSIDAGYDRYIMRGLDGVTPQDAYSQANVFTIGLKFSH
jgi:hypothetical protein